MIWFRRHVDERHPRCVGCVDRLRHDGPGGVASLTHDSPPSSEPPFYALCFIQKV